MTLDIDDIHWLMELADGQIQDHIEGIDQDILSADALNEERQRANDNIDRFSRIARLVEYHSKFSSI